VDGAAAGIEAAMPASVCREDLGEDGPDRWAPSVSDGGMVMGWQIDSRAEMGHDTIEAGRARMKMAREAFPFLEFLFHLNFQEDEKIK
jgi:hypothetical protein